MRWSRPDTPSGAGRPSREVVLWAAAIDLLVVTAVLWVLRLDGAL